MTTARVFAALGFATTVWSCGEEPTACILLPKFAVVAEVFDASTGAPNAFEATLILTDGTFVDSVRGTYNGPDRFAATRLGAATERPGTYSVTVRKPGYRDWMRSQVVVRSESCGVETRTFRVDLARA